MNQIAPAMPYNTPEEVERVNSMLFQLHSGSDKKWQVEISELDKSQSAAQRRLIGHWNGLVAKHKGLSWDWVHGESKMSLLLPLMQSWGGKHLIKADHISEILEHLPDYKLKVSVSHAKIRTRKPHLNCKQVCEYLNEFERHYAYHGVILTTSEDMRMAAFGDRK